MTSAMTYRGYTARVQFDDEDGLREVATELQRQGLQVDAGAVRFFPADGSPPVVLR